jgi:hypothetical protein
MFTNTCDRHLYIRVSAVAMKVLTFQFCDNFHNDLMLPFRRDFSHFAPTTAPWSAPYREFAVFKLTSVDYLSLQ